MKTSNKYVPEKKSEIIGVKRGWMGRAFRLDQKLTYLREVAGFYLAGSLFPRGVTLGTVAICRCVHWIDRKCVVINQGNSQKSPCTLAEVGLSTISTMPSTGLDSKGCNP